MTNEDEPSVALICFFVLLNWYGWPNIPLKFFATRFASRPYNRLKSVF